MYRVYCDVAYQLNQFARNQHCFVGKKQIYIYIGTGKLFRFCRQRRTNGKRVISLPFFAFLHNSCIPKNIHNKFLLLHHFLLSSHFVCKIYYYV